MPLQMKRHFYFSKFLAKIFSMSTKKSLPLFNLSFYFIIIKKGLFRNKTPICHIYNYISATNKKHNLISQRKRGKQILLKNICERGHEKFTRKMERDEPR